MHPPDTENPPAEGYIWGTREQRRDLNALQRKMDIIFLLRDPRDVETSMRLYDQHLYPGNFAEEADDILLNLGWFKWYLDQPKRIGTTTTYESLHIEPLLTLKALFWWLGRDVDQHALPPAIEANSFEARSGGRQVGEEDVAHHLRKGIMGDWKNHWSPEKNNAFLFRFKREMRQLGYS